MNGLKPATIHLDNIYPDVDTHSAVVIVDEDQQSLAIGKKGQNVRLASKLCGWDIDIKTRGEFEAEAMGGGPKPEGEEGAGDAGEHPGAGDGDGEGEGNDPKTDDPDGGAPVVSEARPGERASAS
jgi:transcription antitermination factor NusA-like protein